MAKKIENTLHTCEECKLAKLVIDARHISHKGEYMCIECEYSKPYIRLKDKIACEKFKRK